MRRSAMEDGGKLLSVEATVSDFIRMYGGLAFTLNESVPPGSIILREAPEEFEYLGVKVKCGAE